MPKAEEVRELTERKREKERVEVRGWCIIALDELSGYSAVANVFIIFSFHFVFLK